jgi:AcrR family transcriptional regulator
MTKAGVRSRGRRATGQATRQRVVEAAIETLKTQGFAGARARAIARTGGFNQALVFYYFGSVNELLLAALDATSASRMKRYRMSVAEAQSLPGLVEVATEIYREDLESRHIKVLAELMAASTTFPELRAEIAERVEPWVMFTRHAVERLLDGSPLAPLMPSNDLAFAIVALYLGMEMLTNLDGDRSRAESLFESAGRLTGLLGAFVR